MPTMTTRAAVLALATGASLSAGALVTSSAIAAPTATPCVFVSSPLHTCAPSHNAPRPSGPAVGDHTSITFTGYKPGSTIVVNIPSFTRGHRIFSSVIDKNGNGNVSILVPLDALPQFIYHITVQGTDQSNAPVLYTTTLGVHTATKPKIVQTLRDKKLYYNIAPSVQKKSDKVIIAAYYKKLRAAKAGSTGAATTGTVSTGSANVASVTTAEPAAAPVTATHGLAFTGAEIGGMSVVGLGLLGSGAFLVVAGRRRKAGSAA